MPGDIRFTAKGETLYAIALAWPTNGSITIKSLGSNSPHFAGRIGRIGLLGAAPNLEWSQSVEGVTVKMPLAPPCDYAFVLKIDTAT
jgi:alpha-L-fucosidase